MVLHRFLSLFFCFYIGTAVAATSTVAIVKEEDIEKINKESKNILCINVDEGKEKCFRCKSGSDFYVNPDEYVYFWDDYLPIRGFKCEYKGGNSRLDKNFEFSEVDLSVCDSNCSNMVLDYDKYQKLGLCIDDGAGWKQYVDPQLYDNYNNRRKRYDIVFATKPLCFHNLESNDEGAVTVTEEPKQRDEVAKIEKAQPQGASGGGGGKDEKKQANITVVSTGVQEKEEIIDNNSKQRDEVAKIENDQSQGASGGGDDRNQNEQVNITGVQEKGEEKLTPSFVDDNVMNELSDDEKEQLNTQVADLFNDTIEDVKDFCKQNPAESECDNMDSVIRSLEQLRDEALEDLSASD
ncbi:MAG: hypothetical protein IJN91_01095 [Alphaproteobacteria bacterium]|nr:hypothetical protein [Alphaproteobacteria bacterium]